MIIGNAGVCGRERPFTGGSMLIHWLVAALKTMAIMLATQICTLTLMFGTGLLIKSSGIQHVVTIDRMLIDLIIAVSLGVTAGLLYVSLAVRRRTDDESIVWMALMTAQSFIGLIADLSIIDRLYGTHWAPHIGSPYNYIGAGVYLTLALILIALQGISTSRPTT